MTLLESTRDLLELHKNAGKTLAAIHRQLGTSVERDWFYKFAQGAIEDPGVSKVQGLYDALRKIRLSN